MLAKHALVEMLIAEGMEYVFGNPGTSELPFTDPLQDYPQIKHVLSLQKASAVGMADGSAMCTVQALWSASRYNIPVPDVFCDNRTYRILKQGMQSYLQDSERRSKLLGMDFDVLPLDLAKIGAAFGIDGEQVKDPSDLGPALQKAFASGKPAIVDVVIEDI